MAVPITEQEYLNTQRDLSTLSEAINVDAIVTPRLGDEYKSIPRVIREFEEEKQARLQELDEQTGAKMLAMDDAKNQAEQFAIEAKNASESSGLTTPKPIISANDAILTGHFYLTESNGTQSEVVATRTNNTIFQTKTTATGEILTRSFDVGATTFPPFVGQSVASIESLPANAYPGMKMAVTDPIRGGNFVYDATKANVNDGGYIIKGWVRQVTSLNLNHFNSQLVPMLRSAIANGLPVVDYSGATVSLAEATTVIVDKDLRIDTNITLTGQPLYLQGVISMPTNITAAAAVGSRTITVANATDIRVGDTLLLRKNYDYSLCEFSKVNSVRPYYKDGEAVTVTAIAGNLLTLDRPLKVQYLGVNTDEVSATRSGAVTINGLSTDTSGIFGLGLRLLTRACSHFKSEISHS